MTDTPMLQASRTKRSRVTCKIHCKKCCRKEFHFLAIKGSFWRLLYRTLSLGLIGFFGLYRCVCCGTARMGRFDIVRGKSQKGADFSERSLNPFSWWFNRRDSWDHAQRRSRWSKMFRRSSKRGGRKKKKFRRKGW